MKPFFLSTTISLCNSCIECQTCKGPGWAYQEALFHALPNAWSIVLLRQADENPCGYADCSESCKLGCKRCLFLLAGIWILDLFWRKESDFKGWKKHLQTGNFFGVAAVLFHRGIVVMCKYVSQTAGSFRVTTAFVKWSPRASGEMARPTRRG